uniref:Uncharacterized protein n=1 Tax=Panagrolaimus davidi TaxID=227884 RepID=A0A914QKS0_9BILA
MNSKIIFILFTIFAFSAIVEGGPLAYGACQAACAAGAAAIAGSTSFIGTPAAVASYSACQTGCTALLLAPTP